MDTREFLHIIHLAEKLKEVPRHSYTSSGRRESVAEHCWRSMLMAFFMQDEFPGADMNRVMKMLLIHDLGELFTGDIPAFDKTKEDEAREARLLQEWVQSLPESYRQEMSAMYAEMEERSTEEAKIYKAIDNLEAVIQHNEADLTGWLPIEYEMNVTYGEDKCAFSPYLTAFRQLVKQETLDKIGKNR